MSDDLEPIPDAESEEGAAWERFTSGIAKPERQRNAGVGVGVGVGVPESWTTLAAGLALAAALLFLASVVRTFEFGGVSVRDRLFLLSAEGGSWPTAILVLAACVLAAARADESRLRLHRWTVACSTVVSIVVLASAVYAVGFLVVVHPNQASRGEAIVGISFGGWSERLAVGLTSVAAGLLAAIAISMIRRTSESNARPPVTAEPPAT